MPRLNAPGSVTVSKAGTLVGQRNGINLIEGTNITITATDDGTNDRINVTIAASGGGAGEANTASNASTDPAGLSIVDTKVGVDLPFYGISDAGGPLTITRNTTTKTIEIKSTAAPMALMLSGY